MQSPEYWNRRKILEELANPGPASRLARHGMKDINTLVAAMVAAMVSRLAISFCIVSREPYLYAVLWYDLLTDTAEIAYPNCTREPATISVKTRNELWHVGWDIAYVYSAGDGWKCEIVNDITATFQAGLGYVVDTGLSLLVEQNRVLYRLAPAAACAVRFDSVPRTMHWLDSYGCIHVEPFGNISDVT